MKRTLIAFAVVLLMILSLFSLNRYTTTRVKIPSSNLPKGPIYKYSPDELVRRTSELCNKEDYSTIAFSSLGSKDKEYKLIAQDSVSYQDETLELCKVITTWPTVEKTRISDNEWQYRYKLEPGVTHAFSLVFNQGSWRFVLYKVLPL